MANTSSRTLRLLSLLQTHRYWPGTELAERTLVPAADARLGEIRFENWLAQSAVHASPA